MEAVPAVRAAIFISFSSVDEGFATELYQALKDLGAAVFYAPAAIRLGQDFVAAINEALSSCRVAIVLWSANADRSPWVHNEVNYFTERRNHGEAEIVIVRIDATEVPPLLRPLQRLALPAPGEMQPFAERILHQVGPLLARVPGGPQATPAPARRTRVALEDLKNVVCLRLAAELARLATEIRVGAHPAQIAIELSGQRFVARVDAPNLSLWAPFIEMNGALERIPIHTEVLQRLRNRDTLDPFNIAPTSLQIQQRLREVADETSRVREALGLFLREIWKEDPTAVEVA
jgi:hypothetical protein